MTNDDSMSSVYKDFIRNINELIKQDKQLIKKQSTLMVRKYMQILTLAKIWLKKSPYFSGGIINVYNHSRKQFHMTREPFCKSQSCKNIRGKYKKIC